MKNLLKVSVCFALTIYLGGCLFAYIGSDPNYWKKFRPTCPHPSGIYLYSPDANSFKGQWDPIKLEVPAGKHALIANHFEQCEVKLTRPLHFTALPGYSYRFEYRYEFKLTPWWRSTEIEFYVWIEDAETGKVVSEEKPPESYCNKFEGKC